MKFVRYDNGRTGIVADVGGLKIDDVAASAADLAGGKPGLSATILGALPANGPRIPTIGTWDAVFGVPLNLDRRA